MVNKSCVDVGYGDGELGVGLPVQCDVHEVCGAALRFRFQPSIYVGVHMVREGDSGDAGGVILACDVSNYREEVFQGSWWCQSCPTTRPCVRVR